MGKGHPCASDATNLTLTVQRERVQFILFIFCIGVSFRNQAYETDNVDLSLSITLEESLPWP